VNAGFARRGNSQTKNLALAFTADRKGWRDKLSMYTNSVYAANDTPGATPATTANAVQGGIRYDHDLNPRVFGYVGADFQTDALQTLDLRSVFGGDLGLHVIKNERTTLDLLGGANIPVRSTRRFLAAVCRRVCGRGTDSQAGQEHADYRRTLFLSGLERDWGIPGQVQSSDGDQGQQMAGMADAFGDIYVTNPPAGSKQNDILLTTGINFSFTH
jgi:hypothetical protein